MTLVQQEWADSTVYLAHAVADHLLSEGAWLPPRKQLLYTFRAFRRIYVRNTDNNLFVSSTPYHNLMRVDLNNVLNMPSTTRFKLLRLARVICLAVRNRRQQYWKHPRGIPKVDASGIICMLCRAGY